MPVISEVGVQVDTHIVDTYIDPNYEWNEWELRRKALMLVIILKISVYNNIVGIIFYIFNKIIYSNILYFINIQTNLRNKKTHSVQTHLSHFLRESETQHYEPR